jgi:tRNA(Ile)-lysidine synthase
LGAAIDFPATEALRALALTGRAGQRLELAQGLRAERTQRELRLAAEAGVQSIDAAAEYTVALPSEVTAFGLRLRIERIGIASQTVSPDGLPATGQLATLRNWRPGDRVRLRHSSGPRKVKEILERLRVTGSSRTLWPVLEVDGRILWMKGVELEPAPEIRIVATSLDADAGPSRIGNCREG